MTQEITAKAHAKVNLHLGVGHVREDGYHELVTVFQSLSLYDVVRITPADVMGAGCVEKLQADAPGVPEDASNLAWKAAEAVAQRSGEQLSRVAIELRKGIPVAGGMAGGSADAAATLLAMNATLQRPLSEAVLLEIAAELGSDIPFTLLGETRVGTGRGEALTPLMSRGQYHWALAFSKQGLSTPEVFAKLDTMEREAHLSYEAVAQALMRADAQTLAEALHNDLQAAALSLRPDLRKVLNMGERAGALRGIVSGSGPTCAFLCADAESAQEVAAELGVYYRTATATGPAPGAELMEGSAWSI
ncbi:4-(cytidine 5'-diphospho)-2-C-methyl-D-erythritol kinase [Corynebacterium gerontici]|uniref:4-diphosphocytidyl-2-C-methyl-D-erythritol kinase n=1 Tax=Corynebacterium gerontici TaxID=2079234 RepID=A0A3G6IZV2_9CORY|nr:4-(cytidine 5'-diphospho)-2-C-methyl-D-erythritol kinase [Corynebacterium gerontici]AZA11043.1 4-diphosphocytidyl-2-C-methyl-D-erythritol kinase [Corynebacterium gerontici]